MIVYVTESGSDRTELVETLVKEGITYQECKSKTEREAGGAVGIVEIQANVPEVVPVPRELTRGDGDVNKCERFEENRKGTQAGKKGR